MSAANQSGNDEVMVGVQPAYKPLPFEPGAEEVPIVPVDFPEELLTPAQELAWSEPDVVELPVPILEPEMPAEPEAAAAPHDPLPRFLTTDVPVGVAIQVSDRLPYRRVVTVLSIGDAAQATFNFRGNYVGLDMLQVSQGDLPFDLPLFPYQELWVQHATAVVQQMSFMIEPRGTGR